MSPPHVGGGEEEEGQSTITLPSSTSSAESILGNNNSELKEHNYMGLSDCSSSVGSSTITITSEVSRTNLNLKATELRLGLPGSQSPERDAYYALPSSAKVDEKPLFQFRPLRDDASCYSSKSVVSSNKRGFSVAMNNLSEGKYISNPDVNVVLPSPRASTNPSKESPGNPSTKMEAASPAPKAQVVGWPPVRSFRKNSLATTSKNIGQEHEKSGPGGLFVKVSMDGAPYLRKVDLKACTTYQELSSALEKMFSCFKIGPCASNVIGGGEISESKLKDLVHGSEYALTYEDKDGDWMLVGDVPWEMFIGTCKRLRIMKGSDAIGLAPRTSNSRS